MISRRWQRGALIVAGLGITVPPLTRAADTPPSNADTLEEIIVTAGKQSERALDVPESISVITSADLERLHVTSLQDLAAVVPGFVVVSAGGSPGQTGIFLRGLPPLSAGSLVAMLIDDSAVGSSASFANESGFELDMLPYDIERIEVLRGPQGTLYGANSMGGLVKYVTKDPSLTAYEAQVGADAFVIKGGGSLGTGARGTWSAPLIDGKLAVRASLYGEQTPGYIRNPLRGLNHENSLTQDGGRLALLWQPLSNLKVKVQGIYQRIDSAGDANTFAQELGSAQSAYYTPGNWIGGYLTYPHYIPEPFISEVTFFSGTLNWQMGFAGLVSVTSYSDKRESQTQDYSVLVGFLQPQLDPGDTSTLDREHTGVDVRKTSQEVRLSSPVGQRVDWLAALYYSEERVSNDQYFQGVDAELRPIPALNPFFAELMPSTYTEIAAFGSLTYRISDRFDVTAGLRWLTNRQYIDQDILPGLYQPASNFATRSTESPTSYSLGARYHLQPDTMVYLRIANGYRPGTPNEMIPGYPQIPRQANADTMVNYEAGLKSEFMDRKATLDLAIFRINWSDQQLNINTPDGKVSYTINAGKVISEGVECSATYWPAEALHLAVNAAYTDAYATEAVPAWEIFAGTRLPYSPKWTAAATIDYRMPDLNEWTPQLSGNWRYVGAWYTNPSTAPPVGVQPAYSWVDADFRMTRGRYIVALYAKNLLDKRAFDNGGPSGPHPATTDPPLPSFGGPPIQPREIGLNATVSF